MALQKTAAGLLLGTLLAVGSTDASASWLAASCPVPVAPWVAERMEEKYTKRFKPRTPILPPILPGMPLPTCEDPPSDEEVIRALPKVRRGVPFIAEEFRDDYLVIVEKIVDSIDPCTFIPLVGPAQVHHCHYKCTVFWKEKITSQFPFPFTAYNDRSEVIYIDKDHLHICVGNDPRYQQEVFRDLTPPGLSGQ